MEDHLDRGQAQGSMKRLSPQWAAQNHPESLTQVVFLICRHHGFPYYFYSATRKGLKELRGINRGIPSKLLLCI